MNSLLSWIFILFWNYDLICEFVFLRYRIYMSQLECLEIGCQKDESIRELNLKPLRRTYSTISLNRNHSIEGAKNNHQNKKNVLKNIIFKHKVRNLTRNFIKKARRNSVYRTPVENEDPVNPSESDYIVIRKIKGMFKCLGEREGLKMGSAALAIWSFVNILQITFMVFIFSIMVTFPET